MLIKIGDEPVHERYWFRDGVLYDLKIVDGNGSTNSKSASEPTEYRNTPQSEQRLDKHHV